MYTSTCILVLCFVLANVQGDPTELLKKCFNPGTLKCCKDFEFNQKFDDIRECVGDKMEPPSGPPTCDVDICVAKKMGWAGAEPGTADKDALKKSIEAAMGKKPELAANAIKTCVEGDVTKYGPPEACEIIKIRHCLQIHLLQNCEKWDDAAPCADVKSNVEQCAKVIM